MMKGDHIYTLNHNINRLTQQLTNNGPDNDKDDDQDVIVVKPSSIYRVEEDRAPNFHTMIHLIDDLLNLIDGFLVFRCVLMLKDAFGDTSENLYIPSDK